MLEENDTLASEIKNAENLHGHLGPFLVIGVKIARLAKKALNLNPAEQKELKVTATLPLLTPYSCIIDGIQTTTRCTVGNRGLKIKNSRGKITVDFKLKSQDKTLRVQVNPQVIEMLKDVYWKGASNEELALIIASMPENKLLTTENLKMNAYHFEIDNIFKFSAHPYSSAGKNYSFLKS